MRSKERVLRSLRHETVDRCPCFYLGTGPINRRLSERLGLPENSYESMLQKLDVDVRFTGPGLISVPGEVRYGFQCGSVHSKLYNEPGAPQSLQYPLDFVEKVEDLDKWKWPDPDWFEYALPVELTAAWADRAVVAYDMGILFLYAMSIRGMEQIMVDMIENCDLAHAIFARITDFNLERIRRFLQANPGRIDMVGIGDDVAGQNGLFFSLEMWREFIKPQVARLVAVCREFKVIPYFHGCGGFSTLYDDFREMGIACTGRLQTEAKGNDLTALKHKYGKDFCFWGAIDGQHVMIDGDGAQVREHVRQVVEIGGAGSGFVAGPTHSFTEDTPVENIIDAYAILAGR